MSSDKNVYSTMSDSVVVVADFSFYGIATEYVKTESEWGLLDGTYYYFDSNGRVTTGWAILVMPGIISMKKVRCRPAGNMSTVPGTTYRNRERW